MELKFDGKTALVTGAGKGIGRAVAIALQKGGAQTFALSRTQADLDTLKKECPGIQTVTHDVSDWNSTREVVRGLGHVDLLVNNAGQFSHQAFLDIEKEEDVNMIFDTNYKAVVNISQVIAKGMVDRGTGGAIVNVSSLASMIGAKGMTIYGSSKAAIDNLTKIRVNSVNPVVVFTRMGQWARDPAKSEYLLQRIPLGKFAEIEDVTHAVLFLLSDKSAMINGTSVPLEGGYLAC
ncbi:hypothetical protein BaRGS_00006534 [Batillaria attramentaria]|uniref:L-xylulose reductase n=1 Tax=Batillaria attramentaria TaxID=370345 RepID=A0ABD0LSB1_9CAEN